jgi:Zn-dependent M16 (insulinase) family peptidase
MIRYLIGDTESDRQRMRDEVLGTTVSDFKNFADVLDGFSRTGLVKVLGSETAIKEALADHPGWLNTFKLL